MPHTSSVGDAPPPSEPSPQVTPAEGRAARRLTWRHAVAWTALAAVAVVVTLIVVDNFVLVELRLPGAQVRARLGWVVVSSGVVGLVTGWMAGRWSRRDQLGRWSGR